MVYLNLFAWEHVSVCLLLPCLSFVCSFPISSHRALKRRVFSSLPLILLIIFTDPSSTDFRCCGIFFTASCSLWMQQCVAAANGATAQTRATSPFCFPVIVIAPLAQMLTHLDRSMLFFTMKNCFSCRQGTTKEKVIILSNSINVSHKTQQICLIPHVGRFIQLSKNPVGFPTYSLCLVSRCHLNFAGFITSIANVSWHETVWFRVLLMPSPKKPQTVCSRHSIFVSP